TTPHPAPLECSLILVLERRGHPQTLSTAHHQLAPPTTLCVLCVLCGKNNPLPASKTLPTKNSSWSSCLRVEVVVRRHHQQRLHIGALGRMLTSPMPNTPP